LEPADPSERSGGLHAGRHTREPGGDLAGRRR